MVVPFGDLGVSVRDLFNKNFTSGFLNFQFKTKSSNDVDVTCTGTHDVNNDRINGSLETKFATPCGISLKTKIDSKWVITNDIELNKKFHEKLSHNIVNTIETDSGVKSLHLKNKFNHELVNANLDLQFKSLYPFITSSIVVPVPHYPALCLGAQAVFDSQQMAVNKPVYVVNFKQGNMEMNASLTDNCNANVSIFQNLDIAELGFCVGFNNANKDTSFGAAVNYKLGTLGSIGMKINQSCLVGLALKMKIVPEADLIVSTQFNGKDLQQGGHKYGISLQYGK